MRRACQFFHWMLFFGMSGFTIFSLPAGNNNNNDNNESLFIAGRVLRAQQAWKKKFAGDHNPENVFPACPTIGLALSGGGMRAAIATTSFLAALDKYALLDQVSYVSTLSGSSWPLFSWLYHDTHFSEFSPQFKKLVIEAEPRRLTAQYAKDFLFNGKKRSLSSLWGAYISSLVIDQSPNAHSQMSLERLKKALDPERYPYPLFSALATNKRPHQWFEFSLHEAGFTDFFAQSEQRKNYFTDVALLRDYSDKASELPLYSLLGIVSSAYTIKSADLMRKALSQLVLPHYFTFLPAHLVTLCNSLDSVRMKEAKLLNFGYSCEGALFQHDKHLFLTDAGIALNVALPPLLQRECSVVMILDASSTIKNRRFAELRTAQRYAHEHGCPFPQIAFESIVPNKCSIFYDAFHKDNHTNNKVNAAPLVIYFPVSVGFKTSKFSYTAAEYDLIAKKIDTMVTEAYTDIIQAIQSYTLGLNAR